MEKELLSLFRIDLLRIYLLCMRCINTGRKMVVANIEQAKKTARIATSRF
jgi:hypothetical protein